MIGSCDNTSWGFSSTTMSPFTWNSSLGLSEGTTFWGRATFVSLDKALFSSLAVTISVFSSPIALDKLVSFFADLDVGAAAELVLSEASRVGRDFRSGFFWWTRLTLVEFPCVTFSFRLKRPCRELQLPFPSDSEFVEVFFRPSLGDFALVVGIYISIVQRIEKLNFPNDKTKLLQQPI